jgi:hypothetical protein
VLYILYFYPVSRKRDITPSTKNLKKGYYPLCKGSDVTDMRQATSRAAPAAVGLSAYVSQASARPSSPAKVATAAAAVIGQW